MSCLFGDPDFFDTVVLIRTTRRVDMSGRSVERASQIRMLACITPSSGQDLHILPEGERVGAFISIITETPLYTLTDTTAPDRVMWGGKIYLIKHVDPYLNFGNGFVKAIAEMQNMAPDHIAV